MQLPPICNKCSMDQMGGKVKRSGTGDKVHALSLSFCIIHPEEPVHVYSIALKRPFHVCSLGIRIIPHSTKEKFTPGIEIEEDPVFGFWDRFMELIVNLPVSGIKPIVLGHLEILLGNAE